MSSRYLHPVLCINLFLSALIVSSCTKKLSTPLLTEEERLEIIRENIAFRAEREEFFRKRSDSPFHFDTTLTYSWVNWYPIDPHYRGFSILHRYADRETVVVMSTGGEMRKQVRYGYFEFTLPGEGGPVTVKLNVYKPTPDDSLEYTPTDDLLSVWFTDETTGIETYEVGRYVDVGRENPDPAHVYAIDLNMAYNPFCAYSELYSCAIPRKEDHIPVPLRVGEKKYLPRQNDEKQKTARRPIHDSTES